MNYTVTGGRLLRSLGEIALVQRDPTLWAYTGLHLNLGALGQMPFAEAFQAPEPLQYFVETSEAPDAARKAFADVQAYLLGGLSGSEKPSIRAIRKALASEVLRALLVAPEQPQEEVQPEAVQPPLMPIADVLAQDDYFGANVAGADWPEAAVSGAQSGLAEGPAVSRGLPKLLLVRSVQRPLKLDATVNVSRGLRAFR